MIFDPLAYFAILLACLGLAWAWLAGDMIIGAAWWAVAFMFVSLGLGSLPWAWIAMLVAIYWGWPRLGPGQAGWTLFSGMVLPQTLLLLWRTRYSHFPDSLPGDMGLWIGLVLVIVLSLVYPALAFAQERNDALGPLAWSQTGWFLLALCLPGPAPALGALNLTLQQLLLRLPLDLSLRHGASASRWVVLAALLGLLGSPPFGVFSAYFHIFIPIMGVGDGVGNMRAKLFSGPGLLSAVCVLALVYQSAAFGYFYWQRILRSADSQGKTIIAWALLIALGAGTMVGLRVKDLNQVLYVILESSDITLPKVTR